MTDYRARVLEAAKAEIGPQAKGSAKVIAYWRDALPSDWTDSQVKLYAKTKEWCGGFTLWVLHQAGLAKGVHWKDSVGYLSQAKAKRTRTPTRGDIGVKDRPNSHYWVFDYEYDGWLYGIGGNTPGVKEQRFRRDEVTMYSIQPLIDAVSPEDERDTVPTPKRPTVWQGHCDQASAMDIQAALTLKGFPCKVDGIFGPATAKAVRQFQLVSNLTTDGIVGERTWQALLT